MIPNAIFPTCQCICHFPEFKKYGQVCICECIKEKDVGFSYKIAIEKLEILSKFNHDKTEDLQCQINELERIIKEFEKMIRKDKLSPFKCPICEGKCKIQFTLPAGGYWEDKCMPCEGKGIVWG